MQITCCEKLNTKSFRDGVVWKYWKRKKIIWICFVWFFFSSHPTSLNVATSEMWLFMAWNCTMAETSKPTEEGNGGSAPAKNTTSPASWQENSAIPVQLVFPSPVTLYTFRRSQKVCFPAMNCTPWTPPQWYILSYALVRMWEAGQGSLLMKRWS